MAREAATITTTELADLLGVHRNTVVGWVQDRDLVPDHRTTMLWARWRPSSVPRIRRWVRARARARSARAA